MRTVQQFTLEISERVIVPLPHKARIVGLVPFVITENGARRQAAALFAEIDTQSIVEYRTFAWVATGHALPVAQHQHVGILPTPAGALHLYELIGVKVSQDVVQQAQAEDEKRRANERLLTAGGLPA
jgi:hypothetical protein